MLQTAQRLVRRVQIKVNYSFFLYSQLYSSLNTIGNMCSPWRCLSCECSLLLVEARFFFQGDALEAPPCCTAVVDAMLTRCHHRMREKVKPTSARETHGRVGTGWRVKSIMREVFACSLPWTQSWFVFRDPPPTLWPVVITAAPATSLLPVEQPSVDNLGRQHRKHPATPGIKVLLM